ncbi:MAG: hypothetical protein HY459_01030 [Parcubacteria group bacterium]|nr:hypothetical protein [Parcubacteria group bacterium]
MNDTHAHHDDGYHCDPEFLREQFRRKRNRERNERVYRDKQKSGARVDGIWYVDECGNVQGLQSIVDLGDGFMKGVYYDGFLGLRRNETIIDTEEGKLHFSRLPPEPEKVCADPKAKDPLAETLQRMRAGAI